MHVRFRWILCLFAMAGSISAAFADPPPGPEAPAAPAAPAGPAATEATARAEARVKEIEAEAQRARLEVGRAMSESKNDPTAPAVKTAMSKASDVERRLQSARDEWDRLRGDRRFLIDEAQRECVAKAEDVARARNELSDSRARRLSAAEISDAQARVVAAQEALRKSQAKLVALPLPTEPGTRPDFFGRMLGRAADQAELLTMAAKSLNDAAVSIEVTGNPVEIGLAYERASKVSAQASAARDELVRVRGLIDAARPPPPKPAGTVGSPGPTGPPSR